MLKLTIKLDIQLENYNTQQNPQQDGFGGTFLDRGTECFLEINNLMGILSLCFIFGVLGSFFFEYYLNFFYSLVVGGHLG